MFDDLGHRHGDQGGNKDGYANVARNPRPKLRYCLLSDRYRRAYSDAYAHAFHVTRWIKSRERGQKTVPPYQKEGARQELELKLKAIRQPRLMEHCQFDD